MSVERTLLAVGRTIAWPETPDLASRPIAAPGPGVRGRRRWPLPTAGVRGAPRWPLPIARRPLALALLALALVAAAAAAVPVVRDPVLDWLGLESVAIERVPSKPPAPPAAGGPSDRLALGERTELPTARRRLGFTPVLPSGLGEPLVYFDPYPPGGQLSLAYRRGTLLLTQVQGRLERKFLFKFIPPGTKLERLALGRDRALWIQGETHQYSYADRTGQIRTDSVRTAGDVLLWRRGDLLLRLEGARSKREALRIARSLRPAP